MERDAAVEQLNKVQVALGIETDSHEPFQFGSKIGSPNAQLKQKWKGSWSYSVTKFLSLSLWRASMEPIVSLHFWWPAYKSYESFAQIKKT